jgi:hypothetical protein
LWAAFQVRTVLRALAFSGLIRSRYRTLAPAFVSCQELSIIGLLKASIHQSLFFLRALQTPPGAQVLESFVTDLSEHGGPGFMADTPAGARPVTEILPQPFGRANLARDQ